jgi:DNA-binding Lrp family transcriptional regulator
MDRMAENARKRRTCSTRPTCRLLAALQTDAHLTAQELGDMLNLSPSQAGRRRQRLEAEGYIEGYAARLARRGWG